MRWELTIKNDEDWTTLEMLERNCSWSDLLLLVWCSLVIPSVVSLLVDRRGVSTRWMLAEKADEVGPRLVTCSKPRTLLPWFLWGRLPMVGRSLCQVQLSWRNLPGIVGVEEAIWVIQLPWICAEKHIMHLSDLLVWWHVFYGYCHDCLNASSYCSGFWCSGQNNSTVWFVTKYSAFLEATVLWIQYMCVAGIWFPACVKGSLLTTLARHSVVIQLRFPGSSTTAFCYQLWCN